jgi:hypothetical protein
MGWSRPARRPLDVFSRVNIAMTGGPHSHYLMADAGGDSSIVEFPDGNCIIHRGGGGEQHMTSFPLCEIAETDRAKACWCCATVHGRCAKPETRASVEDAFSLLTDTSRTSETQPSGTLRSVVYETATKTGHVVVIPRDYGVLSSFPLAGGAEPRGVSAQRR